MYFHDSLELELYNICMNIELYTIKITGYFFSPMYSRKVADYNVLSSGGARSNFYKKSRYALPILVTSIVLVVSLIVISIVLATSRDDESTVELVPTAQPISLFTDAPTIPSTDSPTVFGSPTPQPTSPTLAPTNPPIDTSGSAILELSATGATGEDIVMGIEELTPKFIDGIVPNYNRDIIKAGQRIRAFFVSYNDVTISGPSSSNKLIRKINDEVQKISKGSFYMRDHVGSGEPTGERIEVNTSGRNSKGKRVQSASAVKNHIKALSGSGWNVIHYNCCGSNAGGPNINLESYNEGAFAHELGHLLRLNHGAQMIKKKTTTAKGKLYKGQLIEIYGYGDKSSKMGEKVGVDLYYSAPSLHRLNWLPTEFEYIVPGETYTLRLLTNTDIQSTAGMLTGMVFLDPVTGARRWYSYAERKGNDYCELKDSDGIKGKGDLKCILEHITGEQRSGEMFGSMLGISLGNGDTTSSGLTFTYIDKQPGSLTFTTSWDEGNVRQRPITTTYVVTGRERGTSSKNAVINISVDVRSKSQQVGELPHFISGGNWRFIEDDTGIEHPFQQKEKGTDSFKSFDGGPNIQVVSIAGITEAKDEYRIRIQYKDKGIVPDGDLEVSGVFRFGPTLFQRIKTSYLQ